MMVRTNWAPKMKKNAMKLKELSDLERRKTAITEAREEEAEAAGVGRPLPCSSHQEGPSAALPRGHHPDTLLLGREFKSLLRPKDMPAPAWPEGGSSWI